MRLRSRILTVAVTVAVLAGGLLVVPDARAEAPTVTITAEQVVVEGGATRAVIERSPFGITFTDDDGNVVLTHVDGAGAQPLVVPPSVQPETLGFEGQGSPALYAPLSFLVGAARTEQLYGNIYQGNHLAGVETGVRFSAVEVLDAHVDGPGARLTVSTTDPTGRTLAVWVRPGTAGDIRVSAEPSDPSGVAAMADSFTSSDGEAFHGFGGRHNAIDQRGNDFYNWIEEENFAYPDFAPLTDATSGAPPEQGAAGEGGYMFPNGPTSAYHVQSLFASSHGYGFLLDQSEMSYWRMASDRPDAWQVAVAAPRIDYLVAAGSPTEVVGALSAINGRHRTPPDWALGPMTSRLPVPGQGLDPASYERQVRQDLADIAASGIPLEGYDLFAWQLLLRQEGGEALVRELIGEFHALGVHVMAYFPAFVDRTPSGYDDPAEFEHALLNGYFATTDGGAPFLFPSPFLGITMAGLVDVTHPAARQWWEGRIREALDLGFDGFMQDFGEQVQTEMRFADGSGGAEMHNRYPVLYHQLTREVFDRYQAEHPDRELWMYNRSGYSAHDGNPGSAAYEGGNFPGDNQADWTHANGIASAAPDMLNRAIGGAYGYTTDIGGYNGDTSRELLLRWAQWAALSPMFRLHNSSGSGTRNPWFFDADAVAIYRQAAELKIAARPLVRALFDEAQTTGIPPTRPMWLQFPDDPEAAHQDQQWMLSPDVLVAPVVTEGATTRTVYFPDGCWHSPVTGTDHTGPGYGEVPAPLDQLPFFFRCGTQPFEVP